MKQELGQAKDQYIKKVILPTKHYGGQSHWLSNKNIQFALYDLEKIKNLRDVSSLSN